MKKKGKRGGSPNDSRQSYQESIAGSFKEKTEILKKSEASKERMSRFSIGRQKEDDRASMMGRLFNYTSNLAKVNDSIEAGKIEFHTMARR